MSTLRSPQRDSSGQNATRRKVPSFKPSPYNSPSGSESPPASRKRSLSEDRRLSSPYESPRRQTREQMIHNSRPSPPRKPIVHKLNTDSPQEEKTKVSREGEDPKYKSSGKKLTQPSTSDELKLVQQKKSEPRSRKVPQSEVSKQLSPSIYKSTMPSEGVLESYSGEGYRADEKSKYRPNHVKGSGRHESETLSKMSRKVEKPNNCCGSVDSYSEVSDKHRAEVNEKRKHKRSKRPESDDDDSYDSKLEGRKEAKRKKKEEKRLRKEERRRRREERRRRKEERRAEKIKLKSVGTVSPPSDLGENHDGYTSDGERVARREADSSDIEEAESEQKKLEIALRKKALESLRAKKGAGH